MPNCGCKDQCSCIVRAGSDNVQVSGSGSLSDPYMVSVEKVSASVATQQAIDSHLGGDATGLVPEVNNNTDQITSLLNAIADTGWVPCTVSAGFAERAGYTPQVRRIGKVVYFRAGYANTGIAAASTEYSVGVIPSGYLPSREVSVQTSSSTAATAGRGRVTAAGAVLILTNTAVGTYYMFQTHWLID